MNGKGFYCYCLLGMLVMGIASSSLAAPGMVRFSPIPVLMIYPPLKPNGSADDALATGHVIEGDYPMAEPATRPWRIAYLFPHIKDPYWVDCSYGLVSEARRLGVAVDIFPADGYDDLIGQLRKMDEVIAKKYDAIVLSPISQTANNPSIGKARELGIPVFEMANDSTSDDLVIKITSSLNAMGVDTTEWVIRDAQKRGMKSINIALLPGPADAGWVMGEVAGTRLAAQHAAIKVNIIDIKYGDSDLVGQSQLAEKLIFAHGKKIDYLLGCTGCAPAAILPIKHAGLADKIRIVSYGLTRELIQNIRNGQIVAATDVKAVGQARVSLDATVNYLEGRTKTRPHTILVKLGMVDGNNVSRYDYDATTSPAEYQPTLSYTPASLHQAPQ